MLTPGPLNAITDVSGVRVGHATLIEGDRVRTGVTAVVPHGGNLFQDKVAGAVFVGKGEHVLAALRDARDGPVAEGSVGAGTGTVAFGWKGGIGTTSRALPAEHGGHVLGLHERERRLRDRLHDGRADAGPARRDRAAQPRAASDGSDLAALPGRPRGHRGSVYNSLLRATTVTARPTTIEAIPLDRVKEILRRYGR